MLWRLGGQQNSLQIQVKFLDIYHSRQKLLFKSEKFYNIVHVYYILGLKIGIMKIPY